jgi:integrase
MTKTKYTGVYYRDNLQKDRVYYIQYKHNGKLKRQKVGTKNEGITPGYCKKLRDQTMVKLRLGESAPIQSKTVHTTLREAADIYFENREREEIKSLDKLKSVYKTHLSQLDNELIINIDKEMIDTLKAKKARGKSPKTGRTLSAKSVNNIISLLAAILNKAREKGLLKSVPVFGKYKVDNTRERFLSLDEMDALYEAIENSDLRTKDRIFLFVKMSLSTGGRMGSILGIRGKDINRTQKTVMLHNYKTSSTYTAYLQDDVMELIPPLEPQQKLIDVSDAKQIQRPLQGILDTLFNKGLDPEDRKHRVVIHTLRHTFASHLAINGTPIQTIMKLMDHQDIKMTIRYAKLMPDQGRTIVRNLYARR